MTTSSNPLLLSQLHQLAYRCLPETSRDNYLLCASKFLKDLSQPAMWLQCFTDNMEFPEITAMLKWMYNKIQQNRTLLLPAPTPHSNFLMPLKRKMISPSVPSMSTNPPNLIWSFLDQRFSPNISGGMPLHLVKKLRVTSSELRCKSCLTVNGIVEDVQEGHVVCTRCGMIQHSRAVMETAITNAQFHTGLSPDVVHRYSRWIYLRSIIQATLGETQVELLQEHRLLLLQFGENTGECGPKAIKRGIRHHKLPYRLMRHATTIATQLWPKTTRHLPSVGQSEMALLCRRFREYENVWDSERSERCKRGRKSFMNYRELWVQLTKDCHCTRLQSLFEPMKNPTLSLNQRSMILNIRELIQDE
jgi:hypothetical protein